MIGAAALCFSCARWRGDGTCTAFPRGVPEEVLAGFDHRGPYPDDQGRRYQQADGQRARFDAWEQVTLADRLLQQMQAEPETKGQLRAPNGRFGGWDGTDVPGIADLGGAANHRVPKRILPDPEVTAEGTWEQTPQNLTRLGWRQVDGPTGLTLVQWMETPDRERVLLKSPGNRRSLVNRNELLGARLQEHLGMIAPRVEEGVGGWIAVEHVQHQGYELQGTGLEFTNPSGRLSRQSPKFQQRLAQIDHQDATDASLFAYLTNDPDMHTNNWLVVKDGDRDRAVKIDSGLAFWAGNENEAPGLDDDGEDHDEHWQVDEMETLEIFAGEQARTQRGDLMSRFAMASDGEQVAAVQDFQRRLAAAYPAMRAEYDEQLAQLRVEVDTIKPTYDVPRENLEGRVERRRRAARDFDRRVRHLLQTDPHELADILQTAGAIQANV